MITVYIGDVSEYLSMIAKQADTDAQLITNNTNYNSLLPGTYYTSLGDLKETDLFTKVILQADIIVYSPPVKWKDERIQYLTEKYLAAFMDKKQIIGFTVNAKNKQSMLHIEDQRKTNNSQLWCVGCSVTVGVGVDDNQRYGQILADTLQMPVTFLAKSGSSIAWASDQILRSDIRPGDIIVWGLTATQRYPFFINNDIAHVLTSAYITNPELKKVTDINLLDSDHLIYRAVSEIHKVVNVCNKLGVKLVLAELLGDVLCPYLYDLDNFIMLFHQFGVKNHSNFIDVGTDNYHPGIKMHQYYHDQILKKIKEQI